MEKHCSCLLKNINAGKVKTRSPKGLKKLSGRKASTTKRGTLALFKIHNRLLQKAPARVLPRPLRAPRHKQKNPQKSRTCKRVLESQWSLFLGVILERNSVQELFTSYEACCFHPMQMLYISVTPKTTSLFCCICFGDSSFKYLRFRLCYCSEAGVSQRHGSVFDRRMPVFWAQSFSGI